MDQETPTNFADKVGGKNKPVATHKAGHGVDVSVWNNDGAKGEFQSASVRHQYKDKDGQWQSQSVTVPVEALAGLAIAAADAYRDAMKERSKGQTR